MMPPRPLYKKEKAVDGCLMFGTVAVDLVNPLDTKPLRREKPGLCRTIFVGSLPDSCVESHLTDLFSNCGNIVEVRVSKGRNFGHVQFTLDSSVERAMELSGCTIRINNSFSRKDTAKIHVDYAQDKYEVDLKRRIEEEEILNYNSGNVSMITNDLHRDAAFKYASKNVVNWLDKSSGNLDDNSSTVLYGLVSTVNSHGRKVNKIIQTKDEDELEFKVTKKVALKKLHSDC